MNPQQASQGLARALNVLTFRAAPLTRPKEPRVLAPPSMAMKIIPRAVCTAKASEHIWRPNACRCSSFVASTNAWPAPAITSRSICIATRLRNTVERKICYVFCALGFSFEFRNFACERPAAPARTKERHEEGLEGLALFVGRRAVALDTEHPCAAPLPVAAELGGADEARQIEQRPAPSCRRLESTSRIIPCGA
jgi:hypothetical protein